MEYSHEIEPWRDLYVMLGTSSAALMGLLFVATSLHLDEIVNNPIFRMRARRNSIYLIFTLVEAALILTPQPDNYLAIGLLAVNSLGILFPLSNFYNIYRYKHFTSRGGFSIYRAATFVVAFLIGIAGSVSMIAGWKFGLHLVTLSYLTLLVSVSLNAWLIMLGVGETQKGAS